MNQDFPIKSKISENWLCWTFQSPHLLKKPLRTADNLTVNIIHPGQMNFDNGPDIRNAVLEIEGVVQKGDIEFHLAPEDWFRHGHHEDRRYQNLILHVLWDAPQGIPSALLSRFPHLILCHHLSISFPAWREKMNLLEDEDSGFDRKIRGIKHVTAHQLKNYGQMRFIHKVERFQQWLHQFSFEDMLIISLAEVLGYSKNKFPMRQLSWENPPSKIFGTVPRLYWSPLGIWVYLTMQANLLTAQSFNHLNIQQNGILERTHQLFNYFAEQGAIPILAVEDWNFSRIRPANQPVIRLAALSQIIFRYQGVPLFKKMLQSASKRLGLKHLIAEWKSFLNLPMSNELGAAIQDMYCIPLRISQIVGSQRINQFMVNAAIPLLYLWASRTHNHGFEQYISGLYEEFPACEDAKIFRQFKAVLSSSSTFSLAIHQQGVLELLAGHGIKFMEPTAQMKIF
jgi:hypothetical protein